MPSASPTTCEVAAVPRNWQPPPGVAQARHRPSAASCERHLAVREARAGRLNLARVLAFLGKQRDAAGDQHAGQSRVPASAIIMAGSPLSHVATPITPRRVGSERIRRPENGGGVVAVGQGVEHARSALRAAVAGVGAIGGERHGAEGFQFLGRRLHQQPDFPVSGVIAERDRRAVRRADAAVRAEDQEFLAAQRRRVPPMPAFWPSRRGRRMGAGAAFPGDGQRALRAGRLAADVVQGRILRNRGSEAWGILQCTCGDGSFRGAPPYHAWTVQAVARPATSSRPRSRISCSRIRNFWIFLLTVIGKESTKRTYWGILKYAILPRQKSPDLFRGGCLARLQFIQASTVSPSRASGRPTT